MIAPAAPSHARRRRKHDVLLASQLARNAAAGAFDELALHADRVAEKVLRLRAWLVDPGLRRIGGLAGIALLGLAWHRGRARPLWRWGLLAWRLWRFVARAAPVNHARRGGVR